MQTLDIAVVGGPNTGKTSFVNQITGGKLKVANYPGVTVDIQEARIEIENYFLKLVDLPGLYSLEPRSLDEKVTTDYLDGTLQLKSPDLVLITIDATNLYRGLRLALQVAHLGHRLVIGLTMLDEAEARGLKIDWSALSKALNIPIFYLNRTKAIDLAKTMHSVFEPTHIHEDKLDYLIQKFTHSPLERDEKSAKIDRWLLHPFFGGIFFILGILMSLELILEVSEYPIAALEVAFGWTAHVASQQISLPWLSDFIAQGLLPALEAVFTFLPQIVLTLGLIYFLEASGLMMRIAYLADRLMSRLGLSGSCAVPLVCSFSCAVAGIMTARSIKSPRQRLLTILLTPLMPCPARIPVYLLIIGSFVPETKYLGIISLQSIVFLFVLIAGSFVALCIAALINALSFKDKRIQSTLMLELPSYRLPNAKLLFWHLITQAKRFTWRVGKIIFLATIILWSLTYFPKDHEQNHKNSYAIELATWVSPLLEPLGFDTKITAALIPSLAAREIFVSSLSTMMTKEIRDSRPLPDVIRSTYPAATGAALLLWFMFAPQCLSTFAAIRRETHSLKWPLISIVTTLLLAYLLAFVSFQIFIR